RFYDATDGDILIDGQAISAVSRRSLRQQTAYVGQDVYLFRDTIRENIAFGKVGATEAEIVAAAKAACAHEFIMGFPLGYDTPVGMPRSSVCSSRPPPPSRRSAQPRKYEPIYLRHPAETSS